MLDPWLVHLIESTRIAHLGTIAGDGRPNLVPVCFAYTDGGFVTAIDEKPKRGSVLARVRNVERDPRVTLLIDRYDEDWRDLAWLRVEGIAEVLQRGDSFPGALGALRARYPQYETMALEALPLIRITPERTVSWRPSEGITTTRGVNL